VGSVGRILSRGRIPVRVFIWLQQNNLNFIANGGEHPSAIPCLEGSPLRSQTSMPHCGGTVKLACTGK
jgi:hypothetical protein